MSKPVTLTELFRAMEESAKQNKANQPKKELDPDSLPTVKEALDALMTPGTIVGQISAPLSFPDDPIIFDNSPLATVKSLGVNIYSSETTDMGVLHQLHNLVRATATHS